jgi:hypothetical protein
MIPLDVADELNEKSAKKPFQVYKKESVDNTPAARFYLPCDFDFPVATG